MKFVAITIVVGCVSYIAWMGANLLEVFEARETYAKVLQSTSDKHEQHVAEVRRGKRLHDIHVKTALMSSVTFAVLLIIAVLGVRFRTRTMSRWSLGGVCLIACVMAASFVSVGRVHWGTRVFEILLMSQILGAALVGIVCSACLMVHQSAKSGTDGGNAGSDVVRSVTP
jgi:hypothetical protein